MTFCKIVFHISVYEFGKLFLFFTLPTKNMFMDTIIYIVQRTNSIICNLFAYVLYAGCGYNNNNNDIHLSASRHRRIKGYPSACAECVCFDTGSNLLLLRFHSYITCPKPPPHVSLNRELNHRKNIYVQ